MDTNFFDQLGEAVVNTARELSERAEELYEKQKIRSQILIEQRALEKAFAAVGKLVYAHHMDETSPEDGLEDLYREIQNHHEKIDALKESMEKKETKQKETEPKETETEPKETETEPKETEEMADQKQPEKICPVCGHKMDQAARFCMICGTAYPEEAQNEEEHVTEDASEEVKDAVEEINKSDD